MASNNAMQYVYILLWLIYPLNICELPRTGPRNLRTCCSCLAESPRRPGKNPRWLWTNRLDFSQASLQRSLRRFCGTLLGSCVALGSIALVGTSAVVKFCSHGNVRVKRLLYIAAVWIDFATLWSPQLWCFFGKKSRPFFAPSSGFRNMEIIVIWSDLSWDIISPWNSAHRGSMAYWARWIGWFLMVNYIAKVIRYQSHGSYGRGGPASHAGVNHQPRRRNNELPDCLLCYCVRLLDHWRIHGPLRGGTMLECHQEH